MQISIKPVDDMKILDNITNTVRDDLRVEIKKGSRVSIAAVCFSMYAYKELKKQGEDAAFPQIRRELKDPAY